jgi:hypothetical protein
VPYFPEALLVDVQDHDARVDALRHRQVEARVVDDVVELRDEVDGVEARRVADEKQRDREADRDPYEVLFQDFRP